MSPITIDGVVIDGKRISISGECKADGSGNPDFSKSTIIIDEKNGNPTLAEEAIMTRLVDEGPISPRELESTLSTFHEKTIRVAIETLIRRGKAIINDDLKLELIKV
jgi:hypothetical protein